MCLRSREFGEHLSSVNSYECSCTSSEDFALLAGDLGDIHVQPPGDALGTANDGKLLSQWHRPEVLHVHGPGKGEHVAELVHFSHRLVQDRGDDPSVGVSGRSLITAPELELADGVLRGLVDKELQSHAYRVILAAREAAIATWFDNRVGCVTVCNFVFCHECWRF